MVGPEFIVPKWSVPDRVVARVTTRIGGISAAPYDSLNLAHHVDDERASVDANRLAVANALDPSLGWQWLDQVHGTAVTRVTTPGPTVTADALVTATPGVACCVLTADCLSVFLADRAGTEVAVAHAGWRGLAAGVLENTVRSMSVTPEQLVAWLGPAIGPCHFEVGLEVRDAFRLAAGEDGTAAVDGCFVPLASSGKLLADLFGLARLRLSALGVNTVGGGQICTYCEPDKYYSFRRDARTGRLLSMIYLKP